MFNQLHHDLRVKTPSEIAQILYKIFGNGTNAAKAAILAKSEHPIDSTNYDLWCSVVDHLKDYSESQQIDFFYDKISKNK